MYVRAAGVRRHAGGLRAWPPRPAGGRVPGPDRCGHRPRRERGARRDRRSDADHRSGRATSSAPRASPSRSTAGSPGASWWSSSICRTPGCTRTPRPSTARRSTSCCASARDAHDATPGQRSRAGAVMADQSWTAMKLATVLRSLPGPWSRSRPEAEGSLSRRSPPRPTARRAPPSRRLASRWPSSSMSRPAEPGRS